MKSMGTNNAKGQRIQMVQGRHLSLVRLWLKRSFRTQRMSFSRLNRGMEVLDHGINVRNEEDVVELDHGSSLMRRLVRRGSEGVRWE